MGLRELPPEYIAFHEGLAKGNLFLLAEAGYTIHRVYMDDDDWMDGMRIVYAIVERGSELLKLRWHDGNQGWMRVHLGGGLGYLEQVCFGCPHRRLKKILLSTGQDVSARRVASEK
jgi:hypothetical protein